MRIGIMTIHRLCNFGTALQAFALQRYLQKTTDCQVEIIDYIFPNSFHKERKSFIKKMRGFLRCILDYLFEKKYYEIRSFRDFQHRFLCLSDKCYHNVESLRQNPPLYDLYITGSDQVWNTITVKNDPNFYLCFAPNNKPKISFSSCFATDKLDDRYKASIRERLSNYKYIGVREKSAVGLIKDLQIPQDIVVCNTCDPTLLLSKEDYSEISIESTLNIEGNYILVYVLMYAFDPYPAMDKVLRQVQNRIRLPVIVIGDRRFKYKGRFKFLKGIGPIDFIWLFEHASYVVTSSFHGTMFSLIYRKPFTAITTCTGDIRIKDVLEEIGLSHNLVYNSSVVPKFEMSSPYTDLVEKKIDKFVNASKVFLNTAVSNV